MRYALTIRAWPRVLRIITDKAWVSPLLLREVFKEPQVREQGWLFDTVALCPPETIASSILSFASCSCFPEAIARSSQDSPPQKTRTECNIYSDLRHVPRLRIFWAENAGVFCSIYF